MERQHLPAAEKDGLSGAAALSAEQQLGAVGPDVAERLHRHAAAIQLSASGDVGAGVRMAPEFLREDLIRAVGSNGRVDATGERSQFRTTLPATVKRMGAALADSVQQCLMELPASDESGLQYINPPAARKLATAVVTGQIRVAEFVKETRHLMGAAAPAKESLDELREAWRLMRAGLLAAMVPLSIMEATDAGLARVDAKIGATAASTNVGAKFLEAWLRRVADSWETQCVRFRQLGGARPSLLACVQRHDAFLATRTQAAALMRTVLRGEGRPSGAQRSLDRDAVRGGAGEGAKRQRASHRRVRRGGRGERAAGEDDSEMSAADDGQEEGRQKARCAWPDKPRLADDKFKEFRAECRKQCGDACFAFLVGTCRDAMCTRSHKVPAAFELIKRKFR